MPLELRRPAPPWMAAAAASALVLLGGLWLGVEWLLEGPEEARADWAEHFWVGAAWVVPSTSWLAWRRPRSRLHAFTMTMSWAALVSIISLVFLFRFLAEDFGLPARVSGILVAAMAGFLIIYQLLVAVLPATLLQLVMFARPASDGAAGARRSSSLSSVS